MKLSGLIFFALAQYSAAIGVLGIDYGQEYIKAALVAPNVPFEVVLTPDTKRKEANAVSFSAPTDQTDFSDGSDLVRSYGGAALSLFSRNPASGAYYIKPLLGEPIGSSIQSTFEASQPGSNLTGLSTRNALGFNVLNTQFSLEEITAMQFSDIKKRAQAMLSAVKMPPEVTDAAITLPIFFDSAKRNALASSMEIAQLNVHSFVHDGLAVFLNYVSSRTFSQNKTFHVVYDVGAGSSSATLLSVRQLSETQPGLIVELEGVAYDETFGGHLLTERVREILLERFLTNNPAIKKSQISARSLNRLWTEANRAKHVLSANVEVSVSLEEFHGEIDFKTRLKRSEFEKATEDLIPRISHLISGALESPLAPNTTAFSINNVTSVILTGGSVRVPFVLDTLEKTIGEEKISKNVNADESAVLGCALRGVQASGIFKSKLPIDVVDRAIWDYKINDEIIFPRGSVLGSTTKLTLNKSTDKLILFENGNAVKQWNLTTGDVSKKGLSLSKKTCDTEPWIEVQFELTDLRTVELSRSTAYCNGTETITKTLTATSISSASVNTSGTVPPASSSPSVVTSPSASDKSDKVTGTLTSKSLAKDDSSSIGSASEYTSSGTSSSTSVVAKPETTEITRATVIKKAIFHKSNDLGFVAISPSNRKLAISRLRLMDVNDSDRLARDNRRNELESLIYVIKGDYEDEKLISEVDKIYEWFEDYGHKATLKQLNDKLDSLKALHKSVDPKAYPESTSTASTGQTATSTPSAASPDLSGRSMKTFQRLLAVAEEVESLSETMKKNKIDPIKDLTKMGVEKGPEEIKKLIDETMVLMSRGDEKSTTSMEKYVAEIEDIVVKFKTAIDNELSGHNQSDKKDDSKPKKAKDEL